MSAIISFDAIRAARGLAPINATEAFGPPRGKRTGDPVLLPTGERGLVTGWRARPGLSPLLFVHTGRISAAYAADTVHPAV